MSTITHKRRAIQRTINWPAYHEQRAHLADLFAVIAYSGQAKRPLSIGIKADLIGANTGLSEREIKHFLRAYTFGPKYLRALKWCADRIGLDGSPRGHVTLEESAHAALCLKAHYADREWHRALKAARVDAPVEDGDWAVDVREAA
jgi:sRNA-binding protein